MKMRTVLALSLGGLFVNLRKCLISVMIGSASALLLSQAFAAEPVYLDPDATLDLRVTDLLGRMTLQEKAEQLFHSSPAIPRLKVPAYNWWSEALHGVGAAGIATVFPQPIGLAATWDAPLIHEMAAIISVEARAKHAEALRQGRRSQLEGLTFWSPNVNIFRDPRWGRGQETYGEDPYLTARFGVEFVKGLQGDDPHYLQVLATPKHFAVHSGPEPLRHAFDATVSTHDLMDTYLPAFRATVVDGKAGSVMCSYNRINGEPACANTVLQDLLRRAWGFQGYVVSDCGAISDIDAGHHYRSTRAESAAISLKRGTDLDCDLLALDGGMYLQALQQGLLKESDLDVALRRLLRARFELGMFDPPGRVKFANTPISENDSAAHRRLAERIAGESIVLLKNSGVLPLVNAKHIAVVGPLADTPTALIGSYNGFPSRVTTPLQGIRQRFPHSQVDYAAGTDFLVNFVGIPTEYLATPQGEPGLQAEFFSNTALGGKPAVTQVARQINFGFGFNPLPPAVATGAYSARFTGTLSVPESGTYQLAYFGVGGLRLWVDGQLRIDHWKSAMMTSAAQLEAADRSIELPLQAGHRYAVKLEYFHEVTPGLKGFMADATTAWAPLIRRRDHLDTATAVAAARAADVVIAVVGITPELENEQMDRTDLPEGFKGGDRTSLDLPKPEEDLLKAVKATGKPLIVVLMNGSALAVNWASRNADAIIEAWYPGEEGGAALAQVLHGDQSPAGRLPVTFYQSAADLPAFENYSMKGRTYRYFTGTPLYPFGYGLSYSSFAYSSLRLSTARLKAGEPLDVTVDVSNTGARDADEVVQLYLKFPDAPGTPIRALRGFERVQVEHGATRSVHFVLQPRDLSWVDEAGKRIIGPGRYTISVGGGQPEATTGVVSAGLTVQGSMKLPD